MILKKRTIIRITKKIGKFVLCFYIVLLFLFSYTVLNTKANLKDILFPKNSKKMERGIIVDTSTFDEYGGITCLTKNLIEQMAQKKKQWQFSLLLDQKNQTLTKLTYLPNVKVIKIVNPFWRFQKIVFNLFNVPTFGLARDKLMQLICYGNVFLDDNIDLFWDPVGGRLINDFSVPKVTTIHDTIEIDKPELFDDTTVRWVKERNFRGLKSSHKIISVSEFTKQRITDIYGINENRIKVIPIHLSERVQYNSDITKTKEVLKKYQLSKHNYVIFVSQYYPNKNHERLIQAFSDFIEHNKAYSELKLVIVGNMSRSGGIIEKFAHQFNCKNNIIFTERVDNEKLSILLKNALCFVHPSLYEGFGMPVVEAMSCGIPIACSKIPSFLEVVGDAAIFFNPYDVSDIERAMSDIIKSPELRNNLIKKGYEQSKKFKDSHTMTSDYIKVFDEVMNRKKNY